MMRGLRSRPALAAAMRVSHCCVCVCVCACVCVDASVRVYMSDDLISLKVVQVLVLDLIQKIREEERRSKGTLITYLNKFNKSQLDHGL